MNPLLSIIIPFYGNANELLLHRCLESIKMQRMVEDSYEVIVADDGGNGLGGARNKGMNRAKGDYLLFVDADDYLFPDTLKSCLELLSQQSPDMLSFGFKEVSDDAIGHEETEYWRYQIFPTGSDIMAQCNFLGTAWRHLFRREWVQKNRLLFAEGVYHEDEAFVAKAYCLSATTILINRVVYAYYQHPQSILHRPEKQQCEQRLNDFAAMLADLQLFYTRRCNEFNSLQQAAVLRRLRFLTIDYIVQMRRNGCTLGEFRIRTRAMKKQGLLPLPAANYSFKYRLARLFINLTTFIG